MSNSSITLNEYRGFTGSLEYSKEDHVFFGKVLYLTDAIMYEAQTPEALQTAFEQAIDEYLEDCRRLRRPPQSPCKVTFNVRITPQLHTDLIMYSLKHNCSLSKTVSMAVERFLVEESLLTRG